jgi:hypothetical protein
LDMIQVTPQKVLSLTVFLYANPNRLLFLDTGKFHIT